VHPLVKVVWLLELVTLADQLQSLHDLANVVDLLRRLDLIHVEAELSNRDYPQG
jgi:hypothetical protein